MPEYNVSVYIDDSQKPDLYLSSGAAARISLFLMFIGFIGTIAAGVFENLAISMIFGGAIVLGILIISINSSVGKSRLKKRQIHGTLMVIPVNNTLLGNFEDRAGNRINFDVLTLMRIGGVPSVSVYNGRISEVIIRNEHIEVEQNGYIRNTAMALFSKDIGFNQLLDSFGLRDGMDDD